MNDSDKRKAYEEKLVAQLAEWRAELDKLRATAQRADAEARLAAHRRIEELEAQQSALRDKLNALKSAGDDAWDDLRAGIEKASSELGAAIRRASSRVG